jgi:hypothetical protein
MKSILNRIHALLCIAILGCLLSGCIFDAQNPVSPLTMRYIGGQGDTVSPLPVLRFAFSDSIVSPLDFDFSPPVAQPYEVTFNPQKDTATLSFIEMLQGNTRYLLRLKSTVTSKNGSMLNKDDDSIVIYTGATEREPNNTPACADTLLAPAVYGMLVEAMDTDVYCLPSPQKALYFEAFTDQTSFSVKDSLQQDVPVSGHFGTIDTFTVPDGTHFPVFVYVFSPIKGTIGYYKLGVAP